MTQEFTGRQDARWRRGDRALLAVLSGNMLIDALEVSMTVVALPSIGTDLGVALPDLGWMASGFALGFGGLLLVAGRIVAALGRRRAYLLALLLFAIASLVGGLAEDPQLVVAARFVKGICAALTAPTGLAIIADWFPQGTARVRAVSVYAFSGASGFTAGLLFSGVLTVASWRATFLLPALAAAVLLIPAVRWIPRAAGASGRGTRIQIPAGARGPLLRTIFGAAATNGAFGGFLLVCTFHLQTVLGWTALWCAMALLPVGLLLTPAAAVSARLARRFGTARLVVAGSAVPPIGYLLYLRADGSTRYLTGVLPTMLLVGVGFALAFPALHVRVTELVGAGERGRVSVAYQAAVQLGGAVVLAAVPALLVIGARTGTPSPDVTPAGHRAALLLVIAVAVAGFVIAWGKAPAAGSAPRRPRLPTRTRTKGIHAPHS